MPVLSTWMIRASLLHLGIGFTLGGLMLFNKGVPVYPLLWSLRALHIEMLLLGWMVQLAMGVAFWILPRWRGSRGNIRLAQIAFVLLNIGVLTVGLAHWFGPTEILRIAGRLLEVAAVIAFANHAWPRAKPRGA